MNNKSFDCVIIGAGPAGMAASVYLKRANLTVMMLDKENPGGKVATTGIVENYPGFSSISGADLAFKMFEQTVNNEVKFQMQEVVDVVKEDDLWAVKTKSGESILTKTVLISTGMKNRKLEIPGLEKFDNKGISYCAVCEGSLFKGKEVVVIGSGLSAVEESVYLSNVTDKVYVISNKKEFKAEARAVEIMKSKPNIEIIMESDTLSYNGDKDIESITIQNQNTKVKREIKVAGVFVFIGLLPVSPLVKSKSILSETTRFIDVDEDMKTMYDGIYAAGDITFKKTRQISTAVGDGTVAALAAKDYIFSKKWTK